MNARPFSKKILPVTLACGALALAACQSDVGVGADPNSAVQGNATPAASPDADKPAGIVAELKEDVADLAALGDVLAARTTDTLYVGTQQDFVDGKAASQPVAESCGDLTTSPSSFVLACGDKVLFVDPQSPDSPEELAVQEDSPITVAAQLSSGEVFVGSHDSNKLGVYKDGERKDEITVEAGSDQLLAVPNADGTDNVVRDLRSDSTIQSVDWENSRAGGRLRVGQGVGRIAAGDGAVVIASDTVGKRIAVYTADDVIRLHQYGNVEGAPWAVAWDAGRRLAWVTTTDNNQLHAFDPASGVPVLTGTTATVKDAQNIAVLKDGTLVAASATGDGIQFIADPTLNR